MALIIKTTGLEDYLSGGEGFVKALILGEPGAGKTRSASFWPRPLLADCEHGRMAVADRKIPYVDITRSDEMFATVEEMERESKRPVSQRRFQTLIIDTLDSLQRMVMQERLASERKDSFDGWKDWGYLDAKMSQLVQRLQNLRMNIVVNLHVKDTKDGGDDGPLIKGPKLKGDLKDQIAAEFDLVGYMSTSWEAVEGKRTLTRSIKWHPEPGMPILKDRSGRLPDRTPITFSSEDYTNLFLPMAEAIDGLGESETVGEIEMEEPVAPAGPDVKGGPVLKAVQPKEEPAARTAIKPAKRKKPEEELSTVGSIEVADVGADSAPTDELVEKPQPQAATGEEQVPTPVDEPDEHAAAISLVTDTLGGEVLSEESPVEPIPAPAPASRTSRVCGTPGQMRDGTINPDPAPGCGKSLEGENKDLVNVAFLKTRTYLCPSCHKRLKAAS